MTDLTKADIVICGAGIAGISAAHALAGKGNAGSVIIVDEREPLSLTSDKSSECYRNWWPDPDMVNLMNHSIDLLETLAEKNGNSFNMNRRGYAFISLDPGQVEPMLKAAQYISQSGGGQLRIHDGRENAAPYQPVHPEGYKNQPGGADLILDQRIIREFFPFLSEETTLVLHARRAGWFSAHQMGWLLLTQAQSKGARLIRGQIDRLYTKSGRIDSVHLTNGQKIETGCFVNAAGPYLKHMGHMLNIELPVFCELHQKAALRDSLTILPRQSPLVINIDRQVLPWSEEERDALMEDASTIYLTQELPGGAHTRPEGGAQSQMVLLLWDVHSLPVAPTFPPAYEAFYPELALRGLSRIIPGFTQYIHHLSRPIVDGGYYTRTADNRPLIGMLPVQGAYVCGAFSGYGLMAAMGAGELLAAQILGIEHNDYAQSFGLERFDDPLYRLRLADWGDTGQL